MKTLFHTALVACLAQLSGPAQAQTSLRLPAESVQEKQEKRTAANRIVQSAPIVLLGRPLTGEYYKAPSGRIYHATVVQVLDVLRGGQTVKPGTIIITDSLAVQHEGLEEIYQLRGSSVYSPTDWGIYFCSPSTYPPSPDPYLTNNPLSLKLYGNTRQAMLAAHENEHGFTVTGLHQTFLTEQGVFSYLKQVARLKPLVNPVASYPESSFMDKRAGR